MSKIQGLTSYLSNREDEWNVKLRKLAGVRRRQLDGFVKYVYRPGNDEVNVARVDDFLVELVRLGDRDPKRLLSRIDGFMDRRRGRRNYGVKKLPEETEKATSVRVALNSYAEYCELRKEGLSSEQISEGYQTKNPRTFCGWGRAYSMAKAKAKK